MKAELKAKECAHRTGTLSTGGLNCPGTVFLFVLFEALRPCQQFSIILGRLPGFNQY